MVVGIVGSRSLVSGPKARKDMVHRMIDILHDLIYHILIGRMVVQYNIWAHVGYRYVHI